MVLTWVRENNEGNKSLFLLSFPHSCIFGELGEERRREEKRDLRRAWRSEGGGARSSEGGGAWRNKEGLPSTRAKEVNANPKLPHFSVIVFYIFSPLSPTFSHSFFLLI